MNPDAVAEGLRLVRAGNERGVTLRLLGGVAVLVCCPSARGGPMQRTGAPDVDLVGRRVEGVEIKQLFAQLGYLPNSSFNALHGSHRLMFYGPDESPKVDVFLDRFVMCHALDLRARLERSSPTLPLSDLLFTKLQVVQINPKDLRDIMTLLLDHDVAEEEGPEAIGAGYLARLGARDWGTYTTLTDTLALVQNRIDEAALSPDLSRTIRERAKAIADRMAAEPKGFAWRMRSRLGRSVEWYELPEEPRAIPLGGKG